VSAARIAELRDLHAFVTLQGQLAEDRLDRVTGWAGDPQLAGRERIHVAVLLAVRGRELELWAEQLELLTRALAAAGVEA
jgi:hypothetical protein